MSELHCPNCGEQHSTKGKFCSFCGEDLTDAILQYKDKRLPVKLDYTEPEVKVEPKVEEKKYPTGRPLPKPGRARRDYSILSEDQDASIFDIIFRWCC